MNVVTLLRSPRGTGVRSEEFWALPIYSKLILLAVLFVPFQYALTLSIGFPLKISEILIAAAIVMRIVHWRTWKIRWSADQVLILVIAVCVLVSTALAIFTMNTADTANGIHRSPLVDTVLYCGYAFLIFVAWWLLREEDATLIRDTLIQALWLCTAAVLFQAIFLALKMPWVLDLLNFDSRSRGQAIIGIQLARSGPFMEGQHLGFYAGAMVVIALYARRWWALAAAVVCVIYSQSTTGLGGIAAAILVASLMKPTKRVLIALGSLAALGIAAIAIIPPIRNAVVFQLAKLGVLAPESDINFTQSLDIRTIKTEIGWRMMLDNPLGVGPGRYGFEFVNYWHQYPLPNYYYTNDMRAITENGYMHLGSENGIIAFVAFVALLSWTLWRSYKVGAGAIALTVFVAVAFSTQSSWTFLPIGVMLALLSSAIRGSREEAPPPPQAVESVDMTPDAPNVTP